MIIAFPKELSDKEKRIALTPILTKKFVQLGADVRFASGLGSFLGLSDDVYQSAGATAVKDDQELLMSADMILRVGKPSAKEVKLLKSECLSISFLDPFRESDLIDQLAKQKVNAISVELIPRITKAQKMDALSSQSSLAGYVAVILAAKRLQKIFPMQITPAGTISAAKVFVIGAGVAGLQAIATAKRLGARVEAFDTRPDVEEQVQSLGARFVKIDLGETEQTQDGYAKPLTSQQIEKQREEITKTCAASDVVITTAQVFGKTAPVIITQSMIKKMKPSSVIVDMAVESGGNVEGSIVDKEVEIHGVKIIGFSHLPSRVAMDASEMYANNLYCLVEHGWDKDQRRLILDPNDDIFKRCLLTYRGEIVHDPIRTKTKGSEK